jgi:hypothetical protein
LTQLPYSRTIAICNIVKSDDEQNKCTLTNERLYIVRKGKHYSFELDEITQVGFKQKKLLFPLILGGVIGSLFLIAGFNFLINIWIALIIGLAGMLLFYYGWVGSQTLVIHTKVKEFDIFIDQVTSPLEAFVALVNAHFILGKSKTLQYFISLTQEAWQEALAKGHLDDPADGRRLYTANRNPVDQLVFMLDPSEVPNQINYLMEESSNEVLPYVLGKIAIEHLHHISN